MATTGVKTVREICTFALRKAGISGVAIAPAAEDMAAALLELDLMLKSWQNAGYNLWSKTSGSLTLTTSASYTLSPARPLRVHSARLKRSGTETLMTSLTREEYDLLPMKATQGVPTQFHYDRQVEDAVFYVWPVLASAAGETVEFTYEREATDITSPNDTLDLPGEWWSATAYNLAALLLETYNMSKPNVTMRAQMLLDDALAFDREDSVYFVDAG